MSDIIEYIATHTITVALAFTLVFFIIHSLFIHYHRLTNGIIILTYHKIGHPPPASRFPQYFVSPKQFRAQIEFCRSRYTIVPLTHAIDWIRRGTIPKKTLCITFDDGYQNNYQFAFPMLKRLNIPATVFVVTGEIGKTNTWDIAKGFPCEGMMTLDQLRDLDQFNISVQPHTITHPNLADIALDDAEIEISESQNTISNRIYTHADILAYPYGGYTPEIVQILKENGFKGACTNILGRNYPHTNPYQLKRIAVHNHDTFLRFRLKLILSGWLDIARHINHRYYRPIHKKIQRQFFSWRASTRPRLRHFPRLLSQRNRLSRTRCTIGP